MPEDELNDQEMIAEKSSEYFENKPLNALSTFQKNEESIGPE